MLRFNYQPYRLYMSEKFRDINHKINTPMEINIGNDAFEVASSFEYLGDTIGHCGG